MRYPAHRNLSLQALLHILRAGSTEEAQCATGHLSRFGARAVPGLEAMLHSSRESAREMAVAGISALGDQGLPAVPQLRSLLDDPSMQVRRRVLQSLAALRPRSQAVTADLLGRLARSLDREGDDSDLIVALANAGELPPEALGPLTAALNEVPSYDAPALAAATEAMGHVRSPQALPALVGLIGRGPEGRNSRAPVVVGHFGARALPLLMRRLALAGSGRERQDIRFALRIAYQVMESPGLTEFYQTDQVLLLRELENADPSIRNRALDTLSRLAPAFSAFARIDPVFPEDVSVLARARCDALLALEDEALPMTAGAERDRVAKTAAALRATQSFAAACSVPIY
ncbi:HEAT repeat domain-containing protein [Frateuria sp. GZRR35]|uniref:HEAT repeat domain-containing protein n=1 Tax=Frateuria sp. GZRR35 TaxID=3351536 RepID=UPI003EDBD1DE